LVWLAGLRRPFWAEFSGSAKNSGVQAFLQQGTDSLLQVCNKRFDAEFSCRNRVLGDGRGALVLQSFGFEKGWAVTPIFRL